MDDNWRLLTADQLLARVPEHLRDQPLRVLGGDTPLQAAEHIRSANCFACKSALRDLWEAA